MSRLLATNGARFWVAAAVVCHMLWTSAAPAMAYPLYAAEWNLSPTVIGAIFAIYPITVVAVLTLFGDLGDYLGHRRTMLLGLAASMLGVGLFAAAPSVAWLFAGRTLMGIGVGLSAAPASAAMIAASDARRASAITAAAQALGLSAATLLGGALIQYAPAPARVPFIVLFAVLAAIFAAVWLLPSDAGATAARWRPRPLSVPKDIRGVFTTATTAALAAYAIGALMLSLGAQIAHDLIGASNALVGGAAVALLAIVWGIVSIAGRRVPPQPAIVVGGLATAGAMALLAFAAETRSLPAFLGATSLAGVGYSMLFSGGLGLIGQHAPQSQRAGVLSALYLAAYLAMGAVALMLGEVATRFGLAVALDAGTAAIATMALIAAALAMRAPAMAWAMRRATAAPAPVSQANCRA